MSIRFIICRHFACSISIILVFPLVSGIWLWRIDVELPRIYAKTSSIKDDHELNAASLGYSSHYAKRPTRTVQHSKTKTAASRAIIIPSMRPSSSTNINRNCIRGRYANTANNSRKSDSRHTADQIHSGSHVRELYL